MLSPSSTITTPSFVAATPHHCGLETTRVETDERAQAFDAVARLLRNLLVHSSAGLDEAVDDVFPWATSLPKNRERTDFVDELGRALCRGFGARQLRARRAATARVRAPPRRSTPTPDLLAVSVLRSKPKVTGSPRRQRDRGTPNARSAARHRVSGWMGLSLR